MYAEHLVYIYLVFFTLTIIHWDQGNRMLADNFVLLYLRWLLLCLVAGHLDQTQKYVQVVIWDEMYYSFIILTVWNMWQTNISLSWVAGWSLELLELSLDFTTCKYYLHNNMLTILHHSLSLYGMTGTENCLKLMN